MKTLVFRVTIEELPDHTKDYRVQGLICHRLTEDLRKDYGSRVNVIVYDPDRIGPQYQAKEAT